MGKIPQWSRDAWGCMMTSKEIEEAGREMLILEPLAKISAYEQEIEGYHRRYGSFESVEAATHRTGSEDFELDEAFNAWRWAWEQLEDLNGKLKTLQTHAA